MTSRIVRRLRRTASLKPAGFKPAGFATAGSSPASGNLRSFSAIAFLRRGFARPIGDGAAKIGLEDEEVGKNLFDRSSLDSFQRRRHYVPAKPRQSVQHRTCCRRKVKPLGAPIGRIGTALDKAAVA